MLKSVNPFDNEEIKQQILQKEGRVEIEEADVIEENNSDPSSPDSLRSMITAAPTYQRALRIL